VAVDSIKTAGAPAKIVLKPDRTTLYADGSDVACIEVDVVDAENNPVHTATNAIQLSISGPGRSIGIASSDWSSNEPFKSTSRKAFRGKALIVVQSLTTRGTIKVTVSSPDLAPAHLALTAQKQ
jgi:beta-galactosidase